LLVVYIALLYRASSYSLFKISAFDSVSLVRLLVFRLPPVPPEVHMNYFIVHSWGFALREGAFAETKEKICQFSPHGQQRRKLPRTFGELILAIYPPIFRWRQRNYKVGCGISFIIGCRAIVTGASLYAAQTGTMTIGARCSDHGSARRAEGRCDSISSSRIRRGTYVGPLATTSGGCRGVLDAPARVGGSQKSNRSALKT